MAGGTAADRGAHPARRSENFGVRRWLQIGAASAGVSAALFGASLAAPLVGVALADDAGSSSTGSASTGSASGGSSEGENGSSAAAGSAGSSAPTEHVTDETASPSTTTSTATASSSTSTATASSSSSSSSKSTTTKSEAADDKTTVSAQTNTGSTSTATGSSVHALSDSPAAEATASSTSSTSSAHSKLSAASSGQAASQITAPATTEPVVAAAVPAPVVTAAAAPVTPWALQVVSATNPYEKALSYHLGGAFMAMQALIAQLPLADPLKGMLTGTAYTARRTLLNQAPTVAPLTLTGSSDAPVAGRVSAVDAEGDPISYRLVRGPTAGNLTLNADGSFTYTPGQGFDGVDSFVVMAQDLGLHVNLLDPFRGAGTSAGAVFNEGAIKFAFTYTTGANYWSTDAKSALESSAVRLAAYFMITKPVTLTYDVTGESDTTINTLASAGSDLISNAPGFRRTVVQNKLLSGVDSNGAAADGTIDWNFGDSWAYGNAVAGNQFDFVSTAMHELMHSFGFLSNVGPAGSNTNLEWTLFAGFTTTSTGRRMINSRGVWNTAYDPNLTGAGGGLYFDGTNAVAAYGGPVPLFTPNPWQEGSSASHLDDATFTGSNQQLMNAISGLGLGVRVLSPIEQGIMQDLGYTVVVPSVAV